MFQILEVPSLSCLYEVTLLVQCRLCNHMCHYQGLQQSLFLVDEKGFQLHRGARPLDRQEGGKSLHSHKSLCVS